MAATTYHIEIEGGDTVPLTARTDAGAIRQARKFARDNHTSVYLGWRRDTDQCVGYLDARGNSGPIGTVIRG